MEYIVVFLLSCAILGAGFYINRRITAWHRNRVRDIQRKEKELELQLRLERRKNAKVAEELKKLESTRDRYEQLISEKEGDHLEDPADWLLEKKKINLKQFLKAKKLAEQRSCEVLEACLLMNMVDRITAREARRAVFGGDADRLEPLDGQPEKPASF